MLSAITQTPASGPFGPVTTPPISSASIAGAAACCAITGDVPASIMLERAATPIAATPLKSNLLSFMVSFPLLMIHAAICRAGSSLNSFCRCYLVDGIRMVRRSVSPPARVRQQANLAAAENASTRRRQKAAEPCVPPVFSLSLSRKLCVRKKTRLVGIFILSTFPSVSSPGSRTPHPPRGRGACRSLSACGTPIGRRCPDI